MNIIRKIASPIIAFTLLAACVAAEEQGPVTDKVEISPQLTPIILRADGVSQAKGQRFSYGSEKAAAIVMLERFGPVVQNENEECGAGPMEFAASSETGLTLNFQDGKLVGWFFDGDGKSAQTAQDITIGSTRAALEKAMPIELQLDSTLGIEFYAQFEDFHFIGGFLSDEGEDAVVESLYSGTTCFFR
ncbi:MAG: hypothetical protein ABJF89_10335 [Parasphingorhabdus sp.]|uniref:hypothetical protein n=1 Tax=Parasphingorhabdus sp. TaxID=2709688 RepID=UPI0032663C74